MHTIQIALQVLAAGLPVVLLTMIVLGKHTSGDDHGHGHADGHGESKEGHDESHGGDHGHDHHHGGGGNWVFEALGFLWLGSLMGLAGLILGANLSALTGEALETQSLFYAKCILGLPLVAFTIQIWMGWFLPRRGDWLPTSAMGIAFILSLALFSGPFWNGNFNPLVGGKVIDATVLEFVSMGVDAGDDAFADQAKVNRGGAATWLGGKADSQGNANTFKIAFGMRLDNLSVLMLVVVTLVSFLVHLYSTGYMRHADGTPEDRYERFFAYLSLFSFSMLGCVLANSLLFTFIFWELVGLCSYFLIGFYFFKDSAKEACVKAFMTTRVGDLGFFLALMIIFGVVGSTHYQTIFDSVRDGAWAPGGAHLLWGGVTMLTIAGIALFFGPVGKSGQFPLHVWLPDAMEGPTPVSALIHAATMVAAGVYLVARMFPFLAGQEFYTGGDWIASSTPLFVVALTGGFTALFAATIAVVQTDIKKVLAYSTVSQLGYMMIGIGTGSLVAGMFHLWTHAFFKALLFLGSGSVIHAVHSNELTDMGGLRKKMPVTFITFSAATLAIAGFPWVFSGFVSKDGILANALGYGTHVGGLALLPFALGICAAVLTAFYMFRLLFLCFFGEPANQEAYDHAHESPWSMCIPLIVLGVLSTGLAAGLTGEWFNDRLDPAAIGYRDLPLDIKGELAVAASARFGEKGTHKKYRSLYEHGHSDPAHAGGGGSGPWAAERSYVHAVHHWHWPVAAMSILGALFGVGLSYFVFMLNRGKDFVGERGALASYRKVLVNLYYVDWFYYKVVIGGLFLIKSILGVIDKFVVDGIVNLHGWLARGLSWVSGWIDYNCVDGLVRFIGDTTLESGDSLRKVQTGKLQDYLYLTIVLLAGVFIAWVVVLARPVL